MIFKPRYNNELNTIRIKNKISSLNPHISDQITTPNFFHPPKVLQKIDLFVPHKTIQGFKTMNKQHNLSFIKASRERY